MSSDRPPASTQRPDSTQHIDEHGFRERLVALHQEIVPDEDVRPFLLGAYLQRTAARMRSQMDGLLRPQGLSGAHIRVLVALGAVGPTTPSELARFTQVTPPTMTGMLETLSRSGHIESRSQGADGDRRSKTIGLSDAGRSALEEQIRETANLERIWASTLTQRQLDSLLFLLDRMAAKLPER